MEVAKTVMDYIMEQSDIFDAENVKTEKSVINNTDDIYDGMSIRVLQTIESHGDITNMLQYTNLCNAIQTILHMFYINMYGAIVNNVGSYVNTGYDNTNELISLGQDMAEKLKASVHEMKSNKIGRVFDTNTVDFMKQHALEQVKGISDRLLSNTKSKFGELMAQGVYDKKSYTEAIQDILNVNKSRATMIAQTEMSMAYNNGAMERMREFNEVSNDVMEKYWYGFKYSEVTCTHCRPNIGRKFPVDDNSYDLPAHPRCRCVWLPYVNGWASPVSKVFTRNADMLKRAYLPDEIYKKINTRLGIGYAQGLSIDDAIRYINGDRSKDMVNKLGDARDRTIDTVMDGFNVAMAKAEDKMSYEFNYQMKFWKEYVSQNIVDRDTDNLNGSYEAIKGIMVLPWTGTQLDEWNKLLHTIGTYR